MKCLYHNFYIQCGEFWDVFSVPIDESLLQMALNNVTFLLECWFANFVEELFSCETTALLRETSPGTLAKPSEKILFYFPLTENWGQKFRTKRIISHLLTLYSYPHICNLQLILHGKQLQRNTFLFSFTDCQRLSCVHLPFFPAKRKTHFISETTQGI